MICLPNIRGISAMHWYAPTTRTRKKVLIIRLYTLNGSSEICCWTIIGTCETVIFISIPQPNGKNNPTLQTGQVQDKHRTSTGQVEQLTTNTNVLRLITVIGDKQMSVKSIMERLQLKGRDNFMNLYLLPAIQTGFVSPLYPDKPRHPQQKYQLTNKGLALYAQIQKQDRF